MNLDRLRNLLGNDKQIVSRFLDLYIEKVPALVDKLGKQISDEDIEGVGITAHEIKSQSAYLGLDDVVSLAAKIEEEADRKKTDSLHVHYLKLTVLIENALSELRAFI